MDLHKYKKPIIFAISFSMITFVFLEYVSTNYVIAYTQPKHRCFPYSFWLIDKRKDNSYLENDYIAFKSDNIPYISDKAVFVKKIAAKEGDIVEVKSIEPVTVSFEQNSKNYDIESDREVIVYNTSSSFYSFYALKMDTKGRNLQVISPGVIPPDKYFVYSPKVDSYDSRYWGLISRSQIIGKAFPLF